jgi:hypothetical protein
MNFDDYVNKVEYVSRKVDQAGFDAYHAETARLTTQFKLDLFADLGIENNPKAELLFTKAWELGHSSGYYEVYNYALELVTLIE